MASAVEASEQLRLTQSLVDRDPTQLVLKRSASTRAPDGGRQMGDSADLPPITVWFAPKKRDDMPMQDTVGTRTVAYYTIVGLPGTDIKKGDRFTAGGEDFVVTRVTTLRPYEVKADAQTYYPGTQ